MNGRGFDESLRNGKFIFVSNGKCDRLFRRPEGPAFGIEVLLLVSSSRFGMQLASQSGGEDDAEGGRSWIATLRLCVLVTKFKLQRGTQRTHKRNSSVVRSLNSMLRLCDEREHGLKLLSPTWKNGGASHFKLARLQTCAAPW